MSRALASLLGMQNHNVISPIRGGIFGDIVMANARARDQAIRNQNLRMLMHNIILTGQREKGIKPQMEQTRDHYIRELKRLGGKKDVPGKHSPYHGIWQQMASGIATHIKPQVKRFLGK